MNIYRYTFFALLAVLTACSDNDFAGPTTSDEISFSVSSTSSWQELSRGASKGYNVKDAMLKLDDDKDSKGKIYVHSEPTPPLACDPEASRASIVGTDYLQTKGFNVYAVVKEKASGSETLLMNDNPLTYSGGNWTYSPTKYWPSTEQYSTTFYGYIPSQFKYIDNPFSTIVPEGVYTVPTDPTQQNDIVAARYTKNDRQTVNLTFEHLLTTVKLRFRNVRSAVTKVEISGIYDSANFKFLDWVWGSHRNSGENTDGVFSYTFLPTQFVSYEPNGDKYLLDANGNDSYFMMIPQTITDNARLLITFENGTQINTKLKMNDSEGNPVDWEPGKTVTYTIDYSNAYVIYLSDSNCYIINPQSASNNPNRSEEYWYAIQFHGA
ncbi:MAG: fimbrillin family protein [Bacteroidales bacterium]|nr:fimbrillin family protein [Bacteroidales bacterium]